MSTTYTQESRRLILETPLGKDAFLLVSFTGVEELSKPFVFQLELLSEKDSIPAKDIVGKNVSFLMTLVDGARRYFNGFVRRFTYRGKDDRLNRYTMEIVPWLWFLTRRSDCRIFQNKTGGPDHRAGVHRRRLLRLHDRHQGRADRAQVSACSIARRISTS